MLLSNVVLGQWVSSDLIFFEDADGRSTTVNAQRYTEMMTTFVVPELRQRRLEAILFQQDEAAAHTARHSMETLHSLFPNRISSRFGDVSWPPRSLDLTARLHLMGVSKGEGVCTSCSCH
jgi:hypothetical protein